MRGRRAAAVHEAGHTIAFLAGGLLHEEGAFIKRDRIGEWVGMTLRRSYEGEDQVAADLVGALCGYYAEVAFGQQRWRAARNASDDLNHLRSVLGRKGPELLPELRARARRFVARYAGEIYVVARELEDHGTVTRDHAEELLGALDGDAEARTRLLARWRRAERRRQRPEASRLAASFNSSRSRASMRGSAGARRRHSMQVT